MTPPVDFTKKEPRPFDIRMIFEGVEETSEKERTTHAASCHCGAIQFNVTLKWPFTKYPVNSCSCSICTATGYLLVYPCRRDIEWLQGYESIGRYRFNTKTKEHVFCKTCGTSIGIDIGDVHVEQHGGEVNPARDMFAISVRTFKSLDFSKLEYTIVDGKNLIPRVDGK